MDYSLRLNSCYICVKDMQRAINFYEKILKHNVVDQNKGLFIVDGIRFCLYDYQKFSDEVCFGDSCLPSFEVDDIESFIETLKRMNANIIFPLTKIDNNMVLEFEDSEGNNIEVFSKCRQYLENVDEVYAFY